MSTFDDIQNAKSTLETFEGAAGALDDYSSMATELADAGSDLNRIQYVFKGAKVFGQLSTCFAMANIGLDLALFAFGVDAPDPDAMILKAIEALDNKVTGMWASMDVQFEKVHQHIDSNSAKANTENALTYFASLRHRIGLFREEPTPSLERDLLDERYDPADIGEHFFTIFHNVTSEDKSKNPLKAVFEESRGDAQKIVELATPLVQLTMFAPMAYAFAAALRHKNDSSVPLSTPKDVDRLFQVHIDQIIDKCTFYIRQCKADRAINHNVSATLDEIFVKGLAPGRDGEFRYYAAAKELCKMLERKWYWLDWLVIIGEGDFGSITAPRDNAVKKPQATITRNREQATVIVAWSPSDDVHDIVEFEYSVYAGHNFTSHWSNPNRVYYYTWMGQEPAHPGDDIRKQLRLPPGHLIQYSDHLLRLI